MSFPTIFDWLHRLDFLRGDPAAYGALATATIILIVWDWRVTLLALMAQYLIASFLFVDLLDPRLVNVKVLTGLFVCLMLYITGRQVNWGRLPEDVSEEELTLLSQQRGVRVGPYSLPTSTPFRATLALVMILVVLTLSQRPEYHLPALSGELSHFNLAVFALIGMGLLTMSLTSEPLQAGMGVLMSLTGFELFYSALEQEVTILVSLAAVNLVVTLAIAFLTQACHAIPELVD
jgi:hypothetical protein